MNEAQLIEERKNKLLHFLKERVEVIVFALLIFIMGIATWIRIQPMRVNPNTGKPGLWDVSTNNWTLGPDLDPFLFLRWAKYIVENGSLYALDAMRSVPFGFSTKQELVLLPYLIAWFHKVASLFGSGSVEQSAVLFPVFMFVIALPFFFLFNFFIFKKFFNKKVAYFAALGATLILVVQPVILPRTIAGIPEKEVASLVFYFAAMLFFTLSFQVASIKRASIFAALAGIATAGMALVWGGYIYFFVIAAVTTFILLILEKMNFERSIAYLIWFALSVIIPSAVSLRYALSDFLISTTTGLAFFVLFSLIIYRIAEMQRGKLILDKLSFTKKIPIALLSVIVGVICALIIGTVIFGPSFVLDKAQDVGKILIKPTTDRVGVTVAENKQPYLVEWIGSFGPFIPKTSLSIFLILFVSGAGLVVYMSLKNMHFKERIIISSSYLLLVIGILFSRYSPSGMLNGENFISLSFLFAPFFLFLIISGLTFYNQNKRKSFGYRDIIFEAVLLSVMLIVTILAARAAIRLVMVLAIPTASLGAFLIGAIYVKMKSKNKEDSSRIWMMVIFAIVLISTIFVVYSLYNNSVYTAKQYIPSGYTNQWQEAMSWVRDNTDQKAVFAHWWDYGYWVQSMGERATILDGGNSLPYWNYLMARWVLTGENEKNSLDFLYSHNATHLLIDSTDIGKYPAYASIGSNDSYDRNSWISTFNLDPSQIVNRKNTSVYVYSGQFPLDEDIFYSINGSEVFLPAGQAALLAIVLEKNSSGDVVSVPSGIFVYQNNQISLPIRRIFDGKIIDFGEGIDSTLFMVPRLAQTDQGLQLFDDGSILYLSKRVQNTNFARLYLYGEKDENYVLRHSQDDYLISELKNRGMSNNDFVVYDSIRGPIKIWEIKYSSGEIREDYLLRGFPESGRV